MMRAEYTLLILFFLSKELNAQQLSYTPDIVLGHRSLTYLHHVNYNFNNKIKINNLTLFDTEYSSDNANIFFIRNTFSYNVLRKVTFNVAFGMKNPGSFFTISTQYRTGHPRYLFAYSIGTTYQRGFTLEQSIALEYYPYLAENLQAYFNLLAIANINLEEYQRGLQFVRLGFKENKIIYGLALNADQFNNAKRRLVNTGIFIKYNF
ncbi:hypothetical protein MYP_1212 [Sporocytophaga myxococcoides]|uniref:DUF481 domain-containing protein n=1 Tax=Sporocytophaga myxococcoides TaxID=153721 RepID=A0A098LC25_9BACT|nr:hypothetical protein [Sporocytophaga myxococcoides]GAL83984.1 hypothetical protein MYP_1212 [Sporocytophaga myxococcoides]